MQPAASAPEEQGDSKGCELLLHLHEINSNPSAKQELDSGYHDYEPSERIEGDFLSEMSMEGSS
jgi:hypothetical protein